MAETEQTGVWIVTLDDQFYIAAESMELAQEFLSGIWLGEWEVDETRATMRSRAGTFTVFQSAVVDAKALKRDRKSRKKLGIQPT